MESRERSERGSLGSSEEEKKEAIYAPSDMRIELYTYPDKIQTLKYPEHTFDVSSSLYDQMFALSARTLIRNVDDFPFFGELSQAFSPFDIFNPEGSQITFYAGPRYHEEIQTYQIKMSRSRTLKNYIFQLQQIRPSLLQLSCFAAVFPSPGLQSHIFIILQKNINKAEQESSLHLQFDVDSSTDSRFDFDILLFDHYEQELFFFQINIEDGMLEKKVIQPPTEFGIIITSPSTVLFEDENGESILYDIKTEQTSKTFQKFLWVVQNFEFVSILANEDDKMFVYLKKSRKFLETGIKLSSLDRIYEVNSVFMHIGYRVVNIFKVENGEFQLLYFTQFIIESYNFFYTSHFVLEYIDESLIHCFTFDRFLQKTKITKKKNQSGKKEIKGSVVVCHLKERDLVLTPNNTFFLVSPDQQPIQCTCFQNQEILGVIPPLLLKMEKESGQFEFAIWDGEELEQLDPLERQFSHLIYISESKPESDDLIPEINTSRFGEKYWGVFLDQSVNQRDQFHQKTWELLGYYYSQRALSDYFHHLDSFYERGKVDIQGEQYFFQIDEEEVVTFYKSKIYDPGNLEITFPKGKLKFVNHCRDHIVGKIKWQNKAPQYYSLELLKFRKPLSVHVSLEIGDFKFELKKGQEQLILLVPLSTQNSFDWEVESIVDLINHYTFFKFRGLDLRFLKYLQVPFSRIDELRVEDGYIELSGNAPDLPTHPLSYKFQEELAQLYVRLDQCSIDNLLLFYFGQFGSLPEMDAVIAPGRFITAFAKKLIGYHDQFVFSIFENSLEFLHTQSQDLGTSLKSFYDAALKELGEFHIKAPSGDMHYESEDQNQEPFKKYLSTKSSQRHVVKLFRSGLKFPPSSDKTTLGLTESLCQTKDLAIFQTKLIQIFILQRWRDSLWFFCLESMVILSGIAIIFVHAVFYRSPYIIIPLLVLQIFNGMIECSELTKKKCRYFHNFWNIFDVLRIVLAFVYFGFAITESSSQTTRMTILMLLSLCQCIKGFSIFGLFKSTRVLLRTVMEIVQDMVPFFLFVFATTLLFSLLYTTATPQDQLQNTTYPHFMMHVFRLDFGDFNPKFYTPLEQSIFIMAVITVPLVFLNMLIAIMGDTYDRVKEESARRDFQEMAGLIYRYELIAQWMCSSRRRREKGWKYIFYSQEAKQKGDQVIDPWQGRIKGIKVQIERMQRENQEWQELSSERQLKSEERQKKAEIWQSKVEEKWMKKNEQTSLELLRRCENQEKEILAIKEMLKKVLKEA